MRKRNNGIGRKVFAAVLSFTVAGSVIPTNLLTRIQAAQQATATAGTATDTNDDWLHTDGANILDKDGNIVRLTGANWFGFNCCECMLHGLGWGADLHETLKEIADRGINLLRIPVSTELLLAWKEGKTIGNEPQFVKDGVNGQYNDNPDLVKDNGEVMNNFEVFDQMMKWCKEYGIKVMVDVHSAAANNAGHNFNVWYGMQSSMAENSGYTFTTQDWIDGWVWLVKQYKDDDTLIACDLKNEPHGKPDEGDKAAKWDDSEDENNWKHAAEVCGNAILDVNPNLLIMIEGIESSPKEGYTYDDPPITEIGKYQVYTNYDGGWWGGNLRMAKEHPVDFQDAQRNKQIVYSPHDYGPLVYMQDWFHKDENGETHFTEQSLLDDYWYDSWAYLVEENRAPLLIGEWGGFMDGAGNEKWMNTIADYMNKKNISHTFWCINPNSGDTGGLIADDWKSWDESKYALLKKTLWQSTDGKFVGLDHQKALGENGITISEYYHQPQQPTTSQEVTTTTSEVTTEAITTTGEPTTEVTTTTSEPTTEVTTTTSEATTEATTTTSEPTTEAATTTSEPTTEVATTTSEATTEVTTTTSEPTTEVIPITSNVATSQAESTEEQYTTLNPATTVTEETSTQEPTAPDPTTTVTEETSTQEPTAPAPTTTVTEETSTQEPTAPAPTTTVTEETSTQEPTAPDPTTTEMEETTILETTVPIFSTSQVTTENNTTTEVTIMTSEEATSQLATTGEPTTTSQQATTDEPTTTSQQATTGEPTTTSQQATTGEPTTTSQQATTGEPTTTNQQETTGEPMTTSQQVTTSEPTSEAATTRQPETTSHQTATTTEEQTTTLQNTTSEQPAVEITATGIKINRTTANIVVGKSKKVKVTIVPSNTRDKTVIISCSNPKVATVDKNGNIKGIRPGTTTVTFRTSNGKSAKLTVKVRPAQVKGLKKNVKSSSVKLSWKKQKYITGYKIYVNTGSSKRYKYYGTTKKNSISIKKLKKNVSYRFKVRAYKGNLSGTCSVGVAIRTK